jgi:predicted extracellular nuclease
MIAAVVRLRLFLLAALAALGLSTSPAWAASPNFVISQVYGGGGNSGATYTHDFIEVFNRGAAIADLTGYSLQYGSATGNLGPNAAQITDLGGLLVAGQYLLVQESQGAGGTTPLPPPDVIDPTPIFMSATAGKVALVNTTTPLNCGAAATPCSAAQLAQIVDLVGYGGANMFEGAAPAPALTNTTAALRNVSGCMDTDQNGADFSAGDPNPRNRLSPTFFCTGGGDTAPAVASTSPANGASNVAVNSDVSVTFTEPVNVSGSWYTISCGTSGAHTAAVSGGPTTYTVDPTSDFASNETCTVTIDDAGVHDVDADDPPDTMAADHVFSFTTTLPVTQIGQVQGAGHLSPFAGQLVMVEGVVIAERGSNVWIQDPTPDADAATSEGILVFGSTVANAVVVGDLVQVTGTVIEFRAGCTPSCAPTSSAFSNLTITELASPGLGVTKLGTAPLPMATVIGAGGRVPPTEVIENDSATGNVETSNTFDPSADGIDFYETLEHMLVQVNNPVVAGPRNAFGEILVLADNGAGASVRTARGGIVVRDVDPGTVGDYRNGDFNPERIMLDDLFFATPMVDVADSFTAAAGVMTYDFANYKIAVSSILAEIDGGLQREVTRAPRDQEIVVGTYNVENLDPTDGSFARHASLIVNNLRSPDVIAIEEIQDNDGAANTAVTDASVTWNMLIAAIQAAGGPTYEFRQIDPVDDQDGGEPGGNIRVGFLFRTDRGVNFIDRPGGSSTTPTTVVAHPSGPQLSFSPGRVDPLNPAYNSSRKPLAGEFWMHGKKVFVIALHLSSKGGDQPLFGRFQPPARSSEVARHAQAQSVNNFADQIFAVDPEANVIVLGDVNDFDFSETVQILEGGVMTTLMDTLPLPERYSYVFEGNSQVLDQILVSNNLLGNFPIDYDPVHVNSEFADQASDHDPQVARLDFRGRPAPKTN